MSLTIVTGGGRGIGAVVAGRIPVGRAGEPGEIAPAIAFLLGPDAAYVTGAVIRVAGGL